MSAINNFKSFKRAAEVFLKIKGKILVFNSNIGWIVIDEHAQPLKSDILRLSIIDLNTEALNGDPAGIETWESLTAKHFH